MLPGLTYALLSGAVFFDLKERRIPNWLTVTACACGLLANLITAGLSGIGFALQGFALGLLLLFPLFALGKFGGGDVKLLAALGAIRGSAFLFRAMLLAGVSGGLMALGVLAFHRELGLATLGLTTRTYRTQRVYPYSPAIALGVLLAEIGWLL